MQPKIKPRISHMSEIFDKHNVVFARMFKNLDNDDVCHLYVDINNTGTETNELLGRNLQDDINQSFDIRVIIWVRETLKHQSHFEELTSEYSVLRGKRPTTI
jgi:hypothetical protein